MTGGVATSIAVAVGSAVASSVISDMMAPDDPSGNGQQPSMQVAGEQPTADSQAVQDARRRSIAQQVARRGRASTILSDQSDTEKLGA